MHIHSSKSTKMKNIRRDGRAFNDQSCNAKVVKKKNIRLYIRPLKKVSRLEVRRGDRSSPQCYLDDRLLCLQTMGVRELSADRP